MTDPARELAEQIHAAVAVYGEVETNISTMASIIRTAFAEALEDQRYFRWLAIQPARAKRIVEECLRRDDPDLRAAIDAARGEGEELT